ncbi:MAG: lipoyl(octanoyl) transferase LipB [Candidatus Ratteibacteria bacterium]|nr:lipoyl(octanoyl) transferase LipB [Candidatus Ratteibacteria bacterium]
MAEAIDIINLGLKDYRRTYKIQKELVAKRLKGQIPDTLLVVEHPPVFTIGRSGSKEHILAPLKKIQQEGIEIIEVDRGGNITYHGPGQIVGYPIIDLKNYGKDIHIYLRMLEKVLIKLLKELGIKAKRIKGMTGVWVHPVRNSPVNNATNIPAVFLRKQNAGIASNEAKKIASIGIAVSKWIAYHGFALNVEPNMEHFKMINSCGLGKEVTSMKEQLGNRCPSKKQIEEKLTEIFIEFLK